MSALRIITVSASFLSYWKGVTSKGLQTKSLNFQCWFDTRFTVGGKLYTSPCLLQIGVVDPKVEYLKIEYWYALESNKDVGVARGNIFHSPRFVHQHGEESPEFISVDLVVEQNFYDEIFELRDAITDFVFECVKIPTDKVSHRLPESDLNIFGDYNWDGERLAILAFQYGIKGKEQEEKI